MAFQIRIDTEGDVADSSFSVDALRKLVMTLDKGIAGGLASLLFQWDNDDQGYLYRWVTRDGRMWRQVIYINGNADPVMSWPIPDAFRQSAEFAPHRDVRNFLVQARISRGLVRAKVELLEVP